MTYKLNKEEFEEYAPVSPGEVHINHTGCEAGTDTKKRLYIKRLDDGHTVLAYCHHCGKSGAIFKDGFRSLEAIKKITKHTTSSATTYSVPSDYECDTLRWPSKARAWIYQYGITDEEIKRYGIGYSDRNRRVVLPAWEDGELLGYQLRRIHDDDTGPKYTTYWNKKNYVWKDLTSPSDVLVLCEDILSAIKLRRFYNSLAMLTTSLSIENYKYLLPFKTILVFLDNNNAQVKLQAIKLKDKISIYIPDTRIITIEQDPKKLTVSELRKLI